VQVAKDKIKAAAVDAAGELIIADKRKLKVKREANPLAVEAKPVAAQVKVGVAERLTERVRGFISNSSSNHNSNSKRGNASCNSKRSSNNNSSNSRLPSAGADKGRRRRSRLTTLFREICSEDILASQCCFAVQDLLARAKIKVPA
jgi:hypothetical protein